MKEHDLPLAANYIHMRNQVQGILHDLDKGRDIDPRTICAMYTYAECWKVLRPLAERKLEECNAKLAELGVTP